MSADRPVGICCAFEETRDEHIDMFKKRSILRGGKITKTRDGVSTHSCLGVLSKGYNARNEERQVICAFDLDFEFARIVLASFFKDTERGLFQIASA